MNLTDHFALEEFSLDGAMPDQCVPIYTKLCQLLLEPVRTQFDSEIIITSGYRSPSANNAAHGVPGSQHVASNIYCAADWYVRGRQTDMRPVFDWIRSTPEVEFDQLILEHDPANHTDIIHSSWSRAYNRREALEGDTANQSAYTTWPAVPETPSIEAT